MSVYAIMKKGYVFNESFSEEDYDFLLKIIRNFRHLRKPCNRTNDENLNIKNKTDLSFERFIDLDIISGDNERTYEREHFLNLGMQYYVMPLYSDVVLFDSNTFNPIKKEDDLIDEVFEELLKSDQLPIKFKDRSKWEKKMMIMSFN